jgi:putative ABC transport system substrate-binding protein
MQPPDAMMPSEAAVVGGTMSSETFAAPRNWERQATIGFLGATTPRAWSPYIAAFEQQLRKRKWINGDNAVIDYQWAEGQSKRFTELAEYFVGHNVDIIVTSGTGPALAAKRATAKRASYKMPIPVVFAAAGDPQGNGLVKEFKRPGGNITGLSNGQTDLAPQRVDKLRQVLRRLKRLAIVGNFDSPNVPPEFKAVQARASERGIKTVKCDIGQASQIAPAIDQLQGRVDALYVCTDLLLTTHQVALNIAAASARLPTMHSIREYVETGGLMSFGPDFEGIFVHAATLVDSILRGANPGDIAVEQPKTGKLVVNQSTARSIGLSIPKGIGATLIR